jgi:hypothetical protein
MSITLKSVLHILLFPAASIAVTVMVVEPRPTNVPAAGLCVTVSAVQLSAALARGIRFGTSAWQFASAGRMARGKQLSVGGVLSSTVKAIEQVLLFPAASVALTVMLVVPSPTSAPAAGVCVIINEAAGVVSSDAMTSGNTFGTAA